MYIRCKIYKIVDNTLWQKCSTCVSRHTGVPQRKFDEPRKKIQKPKKNMFFKKIHSFVLKFQLFNLNLKENFQKFRAALEKGFPPPRYGYNAKRSLQAKTCF